MKNWNWNAISFVIDKLVLVAAVLFILDHLDRQDERITELTTRTIENNNITKQWRDRTGQLITEANANYLTTQQLLRGQGAILDSLRKEIVGNKRTLERLTLIQSSASVALRTPVRDTIVLHEGMPLSGQQFTFRDPWIPKLNGLLVGDTVALDLEMRMNYSLEYHWKKRKLFGPRELSLMVKTDNPYVSVGRIQQFQIVSADPWLDRPWVARATGFAAGLVTSRLLQVR